MNGCLSIIITREWRLIHGINWLVLHLPKIEDGEGAFAASKLNISAGQ